MEGKNRNNKIISIGVVALVFFQAQVLGQLVTMQAKLDTNSIVIGDQVNYSIEVSKDKNTIVKFPEFGKKLTEDIEIINVSPIDSSWSKENEKSILKQQLTLTAFDSGLYYIPPQKFVISYENITDTISSNSTYLEVYSFPIDTTGTIRDIKGVESAPISFNEIYLPFLGLIFLGLLVWIIVYYIQKKQKNQPLIQRIKPTEPADLKALRELDKLKSEKLWQQNMLKEYYTRLTSIIRTYIEQQFGIPALEKPTSEILRDIREQGLGDKINMSDLEGLLNLADLIKFAKGEAQPEENIKHLENAYTFVKFSRTMIIEQLKDQAKVERVTYLKNSFKLSKKIKNCKGLNDLEIYNLLEIGGRLVNYQYTISILVKTFSFQSPVFLIRAEEKGIARGILFSIITILLGWWSIPWGPKRSFVALKNNFSGGKKVELE